MEGGECRNRALIVDKLVALVNGTHDYTDRYKEYNASSEKWEMSNRMAEMIFKQSMLAGTREAILDKKDGKELELRCS
jgi:hypothetical protein